MEKGSAFELFESIVNQASFTIDYSSVREGRITPLEKEWHETVDVLVCRQLTVSPSLSYLASWLAAARCCDDRILA